MKSIIRTAKRYFKSLIKYFESTTELQNVFEYGIKNINPPTTKNVDYARITTCIHRIIMQMDRIANIKNSY